MIGKAALKYFLLKVDPKKKMTFNPKESIDLNGNTGPFIQYAHARIRSIERKAGDWKQNLEADLTVGEKELELAKIITEYPQVIQDAAKEYSPAMIANYVYDLVKTYNSFYQSTPIFKADSEAEVKWRVMLSAVTGRIIASGMNLLGIQVPERM